jgi:hypothetical protein
MSTYRGAAVVMSSLMLVLGVAMVAVTLAHGFGIGVVLGALFIAAGGGRLYLMRRPR